MTTEKKWVYKSNWDFTLNIKPSQVKVTADAFGNNQRYTERGLKVVFTNGFLVVTEALAHKLKIPVETLVDGLKCNLRSVLSFGWCSRLLKRLPRKKSRRWMKQVNHLKV